MTLGHFPAAFVATKLDKSARHLLNFQPLKWQQNQILFDETSGIVPPLLAATESYIFDKISGQFSAVLVATNLDIFKELEGFFQLCWWQPHWKFRSPVSGTKKQIFLTRLHVKCIWKISESVLFLCLNLDRPWPQRCHNIQAKNSI